MQTILVTGANGFLGSEIVRQLASIPGTRVRATGRSASHAFSASLQSRVEYVRCDLTGGANLRPLISGVDCIIHAAGLAHRRAGWSDHHRTNLLATRNLASLAADSAVPHFIFVSTAAVYGSPSSTAPIDETASPNPTTPYGISKWMAEQELLEVHHRSSMALTVLRPVTLVGEGDPGNVGRLMRSIDRRRFVWIGRGRNLKTLLHREDAARMCVAAAQSPSPSGPAVYNLAREPVPMRQIVSVLAASLDRRVWPWRIPAPLAQRLPAIGPLRHVAGTIQKWLSDEIYDGSRIFHELGIRPRISIEEGLRRQAGHYRQVREADAGDRPQCRAA